MTALGPDETFVGRVLAKTACTDEIDDYVDDWHLADPDVDQRSLHDYLGLSWEEYMLWVDKPDAIGEIVAGKTRGTEPC